MILSAKLPRWWNVTPAEMRWVGLHLRYGRELVAEAALDPALRTQVAAALSTLAAPARTGEVDRYLREGDVKEALDDITPAELIQVAREIGPKRDPAGSRLLAEMRATDEHVAYASISRDFGTPKPTLTNSYEPELLNLRTFPTLMGYSSRIMAESWESNTLYWVALADEIGVRPSQLNTEIPQWTEKLLERIFASHLEDWPAVLKSLRLVGEDVRNTARAAAANDTKGLIQ
jgi:hypothetical protein